jgi:hypothetical protein
MEEKEEVTDEKKEILKNQKDKEMHTLNSYDFPISYPNLDSHQRKKRERILEVARTIRKKGRVHTKKFIAKLEINGVRNLVAISYLDALSTLELITNDGEYTVWVEPKKDP